jgi:tetratricopeptide (TPR) repeat protein
MTSNPLDRHEPVETDPQREYQALLRSIRWTQGFGLLFVQCSPASGQGLIAKVRQDLPQKRIGVLTLTEPITNLYDRVAALPHIDQLDVLFIEGLERSLYDYEKQQLWQEPGEKYSYSEKKLPRLLGHLNLSRERFRDHFNLCFVFLVPRFALKYLIRRAPDFFDWGSGVFEFPMESEHLKQINQEIYKWLSRLEDHWMLTPQQQQNEILKIQSLIEEPQQSDAEKAKLSLCQGLLYTRFGEFKEAIASYNQALKLRPDYAAVWFTLGALLSCLSFKFPDRSSCSKCFRDQNMQFRSKTAYIT